MSDISPSRIQADAQAIEELKNPAVTVDEIKEIMHRAGIRQNLIKPDWDESLFIEIEQPAPASEIQRYSKTVEIGGKPMVFEGASELEVERAVSQALQIASVLQSPAKEQPRDESTGRFVSEADVFKKSELDLKWRRGEIDSATYLRESGAVDEYLASRGIPVEHLQEVAGENSERHQWETSTQEFLQRNPDWVGGQENMKRIGETIIALGLQDSPSVASLEAAYAELRRTKQYTSNAELQAEQEAQRKIRSATDYESIRAAAHSLFGRS
jgi:hypothetical protein